MRIIPCLTLCMLTLAVGSLAWSQPPPGGPPGGRPPGPPRGPGMGRGGPPPLRTPSAVELAPPRRTEAEEKKADPSLIDNADLELPSSDGKAPRSFSLHGDAAYAYLGEPGKDISGWGVKFFSAGRSASDSEHAGSITCTVSDLPASDSRWYRFRIRALGQTGFEVEKNQLFLKVDFFSDQGKNALDGVTKTIYDTLEQDRRDFTTGNAKPAEGAVWRSHALEFRLPFAEIDTLQLTVGFNKGIGTGPAAEFWIDEVSLEPIPDPTEYAAMVRERAEQSTARAEQSSARAEPPALSSLVSLGGRWYYDPRGKSRTVPARFDYSNADRLYYLSSRLETPFADNMSAWLRKGYLDVAGKPVTQDRYVPDNVTILVTATHLVVHSHNLPNHPTAVFPDWSRSADGNPGYIQEKDQTWHLPLAPRENPSHIAMVPGNLNWALPGGAIGIAINGVTFFNPFDAGGEEAIYRMDRCCGHPNPLYEYHYHKYPVCVKSPWTDEGKDHSPVIGFAFDGFPVYGPYESAGRMAKDDKENPLSAFNGHTDPVRGFHYHVTPGRFPYIIGGFWGATEAKNFKRPPRLR